MTLNKKLTPFYNLASNSKRIFILINLKKSVDKKCNNKYNKQVTYMAA